MRSVSSLLVTPYNLRVLTTESKTLSICALAFGNLSTVVGSTAGFLIVEPRGVWILPLI